MIVYRIEHTDGKGMYRSTGRSLYECHFYKQTDRHPSPDEDSKLFTEIQAKNLLNWNYGRYVFGFASVDQLRSWLYQDEILLWLDDRGFILAVIEVDDVLIGNTQCMFIKPETYEKKNIREFFKLS